MKNRMLVCLSALAAVAVVACGDDSTSPATTDNTVTFVATLNVTQETPTPTNGTGSGTFTAVLDTVTNVFTYDVTYTGLSSNVSAGHIHGPAAVGATASPILTFSNGTNGQTFTTGATAGLAHGTWLLTSATSFVTNINGDSLRKLLFAGQAYVNIHTSTNSNGEIRGQITLKP